MRGSTQDRPGVAARRLLAGGMLAFALGCAPRSASSPPPGSGPAAPADADVLAVEAIQQAGGHWSLAVTVRHPDTGWEDYANGWDAVLPDGTVLKRDPADPFTRPLAHPHVDEQPFTRLQEGLEIPPEVELLRVRAHDLVSGWGGREVEVDLSRDSGPGFTVRRAEPYPHSGDGPGRCAD